MNRTFHYFASVSSEHKVLAQVGDDYSTAKEIAERAGVHVTTARNHLYAAEADGLVERVERPSRWPTTHFWRRRNER